MMAHRIILFISLVSIVLGESINVNSIVDNFINDFINNFNVTHKNTFKLHDINYSKRLKNVLFRFTTTLKCKKGWVGHMQTLKRTGDTTMLINGPKITIKGTLGIGKIEAIYEECQAKVSNLFEFSGQVEARSKADKVAIEFSLTRSGNECKSVVERLEIVRMDTVEVKTGSSLSDNIRDLLLNTLTTLFHDEIVEKIDKKLSEGLQKELDRGHLCRDLPYNNVELQGYLN